MLDETFLISFSSSCIVLSTSAVEFLFCWWPRSINIPSCLRSSDFVDNFLNPGALSVLTVTVDGEEEEALNGITVTRSPSSNDSAVSL